MLIQKTCWLTGRTNILDLPITEEQLNAWYSGMLIQNAMPQLTADQREFLMTGLMPGEFDNIFAEELPE